MDNQYITFYRFGSPSDVLKVEERSITAPQRGEVLVRMTARPINPSDLIPIGGAYSHRISLPGIPGYEGVGIVEAVGEDVPQELIGKRVLPLRGEGTWQRFVKAPAAWAIAIPDTLGDDMAAQLYINPVTAWVICRQILGLKPGDVLIVNACGSSLGRIFAQLSRCFGVRLIAVTRNDRHTKELLRLGAMRVINENELDLLPTIMELTGGLGVNAAVDMVGGEPGTELACCVGGNGIFVTLGLLSGISLNWVEIKRRTNASATMFHLRHWNEAVSAQGWQDTFRELISLVQAGKLSLLPPRSRFELCQVDAAVREAEANEGKQGKCFLM
ncbi:zinc-dependent alcohol dehydrogenase family protein [Paenibacillus lentus]|uniref:zinc-dependent alcohol dehydrogenase family protein n=1 Tax=Paenibacillus lentus TaxID=1338368 RepID=UPI0013DDF03C|nr:zinc-dependent alcohol dehydrogenase family protein [Paenibacillus lentus]